jgi:hypothetical protein
MACDTLSGIPGRLKRPPPSLTWRQMLLLNRIGNAYQLELKRLSTVLPDDTQISGKGESSKTAHSRRREQVRKAQRSIHIHAIHLPPLISYRKHRERKETYIKSLEQQVLQLLNEQVAAAQQRRAVEEENTMLKGLLQQHGIALPREAAGFGPAATISMLDLPGGLQRLQVTMPETGSHHFAAFDNSHSALPKNSISPESIDIDALDTLSSGRSSTPQRTPSAPPTAFHTRLPSESVHIHPIASPGSTSTGKALPSLPSSAPNQPVPHPNGLDAAQVGIDFVLALENPCLVHTRKDLDSADSYGHILTTQAPLLTNGPRSHEQASSWTIPAVEIERLLNLSSQLNLAGELTPVQAWSRVRSYPGFEKLNLDQLEILKQALLQEIQCYGYVYGDT